MIKPILTIILVLCIIFIVLCAFDGYVQSLPRIDPTDYEERIDYGILSEEQIKTFDDIFHAGQNGDSFVTCPSFSPEERHEIITQLGMYFGDIEGAQHLIFWTDDIIYLDLDQFEKLMAQKTIIDARIDEALSTFIEGSDKLKLLQISNYVSSKMVYAKGVRNIMFALNGEGNCESYSMLFYKMSSRLGLQSYICYGYTDSDGYHAWNAVDLNGEYIYYDITWYDSDMHNLRYIFNKDSWNRVFQLNNRWSSDLNNLD